MTTIQPVYDSKWREVRVTSNSVKADTGKQMVAAPSHAENTARSAVWSRWTHVGAWLLLAAIYVVAAKISLALAFVNPSATAVWPPTGIALAAVLIFGPRISPGIFVGAFLANETTVGTLTTSVLIAAGNTAEALLGGYLVDRFAGGRSAFIRARSIALFVVFAFASASVSATIGVSTLAVAFHQWSDYWLTWFTWWLGDTAGALVVAPAILFWYAEPRVGWSPRQWSEAVALLALVTVVGLVVFVYSDSPLGFLCIPLCVLVGFRFGQREAATVSCIFSLLAIWGTLQGLGTFGGRAINDALLMLQTFMAVASIVGITVGAVKAGWRAESAQLQHANEDLERRVRSDASERRLQAIIDAEPACVKLVSPDGNLLEMNRAGLGMIGADRVAQIAGRPILDLVHPLDRDRYLETHLAASVGSPGRLEFRIITLAGEERWMEAHSVPFALSPEENAGRCAVLSVTSDTTERRRLEDQLHHGQKMEAVGVLAAGIAHDFNNLLTAIGGYAEFILDTFDDSDVRRRDVIEISKATGRAAALTRQLLAFGRRQTLQPKVLDVNLLVAEVHKLLQRTIPEHIAFVLDLASSLDHVRTDSGQLQQVLMNLAMNAADAMPQGGELRFVTDVVNVDERSARQRPPMTPGRYARIVVRDTGIGMPPETVARVFDPFFTTKQSGKGTGLGLATVYGIVKQSGGFIWVTSQLTRGTSFEIYLPAVQEPLEAVSPVSDKTEPVGGTETILLAEDDGAVRRLAAKVLRRYGYHVLEARDGEEAIAMASRHEGPIHLLVTDVIMPGRTGRELAESLSEFRPDLGVLYCSGYSAEVRQGVGLVRDLPLLAKPYPLKQLLHKVREILDGKAPQNGGR